MCFIVFDALLVMQLKTRKPIELFSIDPVKKGSTHMRAWSSKGFKYYILFVDDWSYYYWVIQMRAKSEATMCFIIEFINLVENQYNTCIKILRANNGEYCNTTLQNIWIQAYSTSTHVHIPRIKWKASTHTWYNLCSSWCWASSWILSCHSRSYHFFTIIYH